MGANSHEYMSYKHSVLYFKPTGTVRFGRLIVGSRSGTGKCQESFTQTGWRLLAVFDSVCSETGVRLFWMLWEKLHFCHPTYTELGWKPSQDYIKCSQMSDCFKSCFNQKCKDLWYHSFSPTSFQGWWDLTLDICSIFSVDLVPIAFARFSRKSRCRSSSGGIFNEEIDVDSVEKLDQGVTHIFTFSVRSVASKP